MAVDNMLTREDLDALPDDLLRHELIDGGDRDEPRAGFRHHMMSSELLMILKSVRRGTDLVVLDAPFDVVLGSSVVEPDLLVGAQSRLHREGPAGRTLTRGRGSLRINGLT